MANKLLDDNGDTKAAKGGRKGHPRREFYEYC